MEDDRRRVSEEEGTQRVTDPLGTEEGKTEGRGSVKGIDYVAASWCQRRAIKLWDPPTRDRWVEACRQSRAEYRIAKWLALVFGV